MTPKVSIIVPIYNAGKFLEKCLDTLVNQTLKDIEIILVDDGSPDNCGKICDEYAAKDTRIKVDVKKLDIKKIPLEAVWKQSKILAEHLFLN